ncbi:MAG: hypothetical protein M1837_006144 [Sclerophora amabilis]|nr:MAG: hypothetical protein M1837_006144 [Sclerophora amabilis]
MDATLDHLLTVLRDRDIPLTRDDVQWAFESPNTRLEVTRWVEEYLGTETLLSKEDLQLYSRLEKSNEIQTLSSTYDLSTIRPTTDDELRWAVSKLQESTRAIEGHNEQLREQRKAIAALKRRTQDEGLHRNRLRIQHGKKHAVEKEHVSLAVEEISESLDSQLKDLNQQIRSGRISLNSTIIQNIRSDDATLARLDKLLIGFGAETESDTTQQLMSARTRALCKKLIALKVEQIQCRLDRSFSEAQANPQALNGSDTEGSDVQLDIEVLEEELGSLYSEILPVAQMSVSRQHSQPLLQQIKEDAERVQKFSVATLQHVCHTTFVLCICVVFLMQRQILSTLEYLTSKLETVTARAQAYNSHCQAIESISSTVVTEFQDLTAKRNPSPSKTLSPTRERQSKSVSKPPTRVTSQERRSSDDLTLNDAMPERQLMAALGLSFEKLPGTEDLDHTMLATVKERRSLLHKQIASLENSTNATLVASLRASSASLQKLQDTLYADSQYGTVELLGKETRLDIETLERSLNENGTGISVLDLEVVREADTKKEQFIERWSH